MIAIFIMFPSGHALFYFVDVFQNVSCEFSINLDVKSYASCAHNSIVLGFSAITFCARSSIDARVVWCIVGIGSHSDWGAHDAKYDPWSNDSAFGAFNKYLLAIAKHA